MRTVQLCQFLLAACLTSFGLGCCHHDMRAFNVNVKLDESLRDAAGALPPVEINLVGVPAEDVPRWEAKPMSDYFKPSDSLRDSANKAVLHLGEDTPSKTFSAGDKLWERWKGQGAVQLLILSDYPRSHPDAPGQQDPRRRVLPLDECRWGNRRDIQIVVTKPGELIVLTPPEPVD